MTSLSKFQGRTVNYGSVRADEIYEKMTSDKHFLLQPQSMKITRNAKFKCILAVCIWTLAFLKVSIRVYGVCMEHIECHLGHFTPVRNTIHSICARSLYCVFRRLCVRCIAPWDSGNSATMSFRNLHVYHGDSYGSHRISIYTAHRRSIFV